MSRETILEQLHAIDRECRYLEKTSGLLQWDQETQLPPEGVEERAEQIALLQSIWHQKLTEPRIGGLLAELGSDEQNPAGDEKLPPLERDFCRVLRR
ncbi:MAG: carboxypeptidase M32, partial [Spirochaetaceae bacterium]|nr:carboxypeptidase M32 [Spirochaetaceae bacterium]